MVAAEEMGLGVQPRPLVTLRSKKKHRLLIRTSPVSSSRFVVGPVDLEQPSHSGKIQPGWKDLRLSRQVDEPRKAGVHVQKVQLFEDRLRQTSPQQASQILSEPNQEAGVSSRIGVASRRCGVEQGEKLDLLSSLRQPPRHLEGDEPADGPPRQC